MMEGAVRLCSSVQGTPSLDAISNMHRLVLRSLFVVFLEHQPSALETQGA
jgi:hypothetical protein